eukprot:CAMPEP_0197847448 /NCGR_PEP_ID=MMETSP1438-20131217/6245_1 /TAXON_ID=1461541 /ORGANISM="Pterosperma sp., Strain CCMP1384" /LENGTH=378 /DNA_ID=CAMNT_0043459377 /DNA_START=104 /DNA_END=1240 /DNA_ORIENTATION=+
MEDSLDLFRAEGRIPGYQGYIPGMKNHVIGKRYTDASNKAEECTAVLRDGGNPSGLESLVDDRPQGRHNLYAQVANHGPQEQPQLAPPHVGKRIPMKNPAHGEVDFRTMPKVIGGLGDHQTQVIKSASLPTLPYSNKKFVTKKVYAEELPAEAKDASGMVPGYTGHQHAAQHVFSKSYGSTTRELAGDNAETTDKSKNFLLYGEERPVGDKFTSAHRIPGYQGYIPGKDNHIYGKTYGASTELAPMTEDLLRSGANVNSAVELVDHRPQGRVELYAQSFNINPNEPPKPLEVHMGKGMVNVQYTEKGVDYKIREKVADDIREVKEAKHRVVGYTGHVHGDQHVYAASYGKMTRSLQKQSNPVTSDELLYWQDDRPHQK